MDELPLPPAPAGRRAAEELFDNSTERPSPLTPVYTFPSLSWGTSSNFYTTQQSREIRDDCRSPPASTPGSSAPARRSSRDRRQSHSLGTWTFSVDQPFNPTNLVDVRPGAGVGEAVRHRELVKLPTYTPNVMSDTYVEDEWKPAAGVTLNLGLRYDYQFKVFNQG